MASWTEVFRFPGNTLHIIPIPFTRASCQKNASISPSKQKPEDVELNYWILIPSDVFNLVLAGQEWNLQLIIGKRSRAYALNQPTHAVWKLG